MKRSRVGLLTELCVLGAIVLAPVLIAVLCIAIFVAPWLLIVFAPFGLDLFNWGKAGPPPWRR